MIGKVLREGRALLGFAYDVVGILFFRKRDEPEELAPVAEADTSPVVRISPSAAGMVARASPAPRMRTATNAPLEGSIEARRAPESE